MRYESSVGRFLTLHAKADRPFALAEHQTLQGRKTLLYLRPERRAAAASLPRLRSRTDADS